MKLTLRQKFLGAFLLVGIVPTLMITIYTSITLSKLIHHEEKDKLEAIVDGRLSSLTDLYETIENQLITFSNGDTIKGAAANFAAAVAEMEIGTPDKAKLEQRYAYQRENSPNATAADEESWLTMDSTAAYLQHLYVSNNPHPIGEKQNLEDAKDGSTYSLLHKEYHKPIKQFLEAFGYYNIFIIEPEKGRIIYSVFKEVDYGTKLLHGPHSKTGLADVVKKALKGKSGETFFADFGTYAPSYNALAGFAATPIYKQGRLVGALAFQMPVDKINDIMKHRTGLGKTGHTFILGLDGKMQSDSPLDEKNNFGQQIHGEEVDQILAKEHSAGRMKNAHGEEVFADWDTFSFKNITVRIVAEMKESEIKESIYQVLEGIIAIGAIFALGAAAVGWFMASSISRAILQIAQEFSKLANYDLRSYIKNTRTDEIGDMCTQFNEFTGKLKELVGKVRNASTQIAAASQEMSSSTGHMNNMSQEQQGALTQISAAVEESSSTAEEINSLAISTSKNVEVIATAARDADVAMNTLRNNSKQIVEVTDVINDISDQINLLALNAAIEAARAGDAGRGFAVVADEVRKLAANTNSSTEEIAKVVNELQSNVGATSDALGNITNSIGKITEEVAQVSNSLQEQTKATQDIASTVGEFHAQMEHMVNNIKETDQAASDVAKEATELDQEVSNFKV